MSWKIALPLLMAVMSVSMYYGARFARVRAQLGTVVVVCALSSILLMIPWIGWLLAIYCMLRLTSRLTDAEFWPDAVVVSFIALLLPLLINFFR
jgi:putative Mn2+ efflux pump MntP